MKILSKVHTLHGRGHSSDIFVVFSSYFLIVERNIHSYRNHFYANREIFRITSDSNVKFYITFLHQTIFEFNLAGVWDKEA